MYFPNLIYCVQNRNSLAVNENLIGREHDDQVKNNGTIELVVTVQSTKAPGQVYLNMPVPS